MKTNRILALLSVCGLFTGTVTLNMVANYRHNGSCQDGTCGRQHCGTCHSHRRACGSCPTGHTYSSSCEEKPVCEKMVPVRTAPCKQCDTVTTCNYTCPTDYYKAGTCKAAESDSRVGTAQQDSDGAMYTNGSAAAATTEEEVVVAEEESKPAKGSKRYSKKMKNQ
jgi:hypothetical protein